MDLLVGSSSRSSIWRMVLCLRLNGLVYIFARVAGNRLSNTIRSRSVERFSSISPKEKVSFLRRSSGRHFLSLSLIIPPQRLARKLAWLAFARGNDLQQLRHCTLDPLALGMIAQRHPAPLIYARRSVTFVRSRTSSFALRGARTVPQVHRRVGNCTCLSFRPAIRTLAKVKGEGFFYPRAATRIFAAVAPLTPDIGKEKREG